MSTIEKHTITALIPSGFTPMSPEVAGESGRTKVDQLRSRIDGIIAKRDSVLDDHEGKIYFFGAEQTEGLSPEDLASIDVLAESVAFFAVNHRLQERVGEDTVAQIIRSSIAATVAYLRISGRLDGSMKMTDDDFAALDLVMTASSDAEGGRFADEHRSTYVQRKLVEWAKSFKNRYGNEPGSSLVYPEIDDLRREYDSEELSRQLKAAFDDETVLDEVLDKSGTGEDLTEEESKVYETYMDIVSYDTAEKDEAVDRRVELSMIAGLLGLSADVKQAEQEGGRYVVPTENVGGTS